jgi:regulator of replication initiation timing
MFNQNEANRLINTFSDILSQMEELKRAIDQLSYQAKDLIRDLENLPAEVDELKEALGLNDEDEEEKDDDE